MELDTTVERAAPAGALADEEIVTRVLAGEKALFEILVRRYNQRLYRVALGILGDDAEAEDVMQDAYVRAYSHLAQFAGEARFSTWLTRIAVYEALARARRRRRAVEMDAMPDRSKETLTISTERNPEERAIGRDLRSVLEAAIQALPEAYRIVVLLRDVEGLNTAEAAGSLGLSEPLLKVRLHRGRAMLRRDLASRAHGALDGVFQFHLSRCDRVVAAVMQRIERAV
ncbi:MAG TPA: RNA polymerase sigma factor [Thermoanaerobaculia bacterium]|jgi:RNA polymerase sigma-70 factor (ECF subfamily)|nr:RNA polymerase sigma factor [Thermoanaerobaculia bacterium]